MNHEYHGEFEEEYLRRLDENRNPFDTETVGA